MIPEGQRIVREIFGPLARGNKGAEDLADDAATWSPAPGCEAVITTEMLVAGVHFGAGDPPGLVAAKALRVNLSDLAAKAAKAKIYFLALALANDTDETWLKGFAEGLAADQAEFGVALSGGDTVRTSGPLTVAVTAIGEVPSGQAVHRGGARAGDNLYVTGTIGDGALGRELVRARPRWATMVPASDREFLLSRYRRPEPRLAAADALRAHARAAIDISAGLAADLDLLCAASGVSAQLDAMRAPFSDSAIRAFACDKRLMGLCLSGGGDYELLAAVAPEASRQFELDVRRAGVPVTRVGRCLETAEGEARVVGTYGAPLKLRRRSWIDSD